MERKRVNFILKEFGFALLQFFFSRVNLFGFISPVGLPFAFARLHYGGNIFTVLLAFFISKIYLFSGLNHLAITIYEVVVLTLFYLAQEFLKTKRKVLLMYLFLILSNALALYYNIFNLTNLWHFLLNFGLQNLALYYFYKLFQIYKNKFIFFKFSNTDYLFFSIFILFFSIGVFEYKFILSALGLFILSIFVQFLCKILPSNKFFVFVCIFALGMVTASKNYLFLCFASVFGVIFFQIKDVNKYLFGTLSLLFYAVFAIFFKIYDLVSIISLAASVILVMAVPNRLTAKLRSYFEIEENDILSREIELSRVKKIQGKLLMMSSTLSSMQNSFKYLLIGKIDRVKASRELSSDIISKCCAHCELYKTCFLENLNKRSLIESLLFKAIENSEISESDLTNGIVSYCSKKQILLGDINQTARLFLSYEKSVKSEDASKLMIASEIQNFSNIFLNFAKIIEKSAKINQKLSKTLKEALFNNLIDAKEVAILENENGIISVSLVLSNSQALKREVVETVSRVVKIPFKTKSINHLEYSGICLAELVPVSLVRPEFAVSAKPKEEKNGDNALVTKLDENKFFVALADGMGHGDNANKISNTVLSLIRSFFEIGLDEELIISSVNKLLLPVGLENFTTLDCCVLDFDRMVCTFIKLGSSVSVIKHKDTSELISCASLPIGIVQDIRPTIVTRPISVGDKIFLASDGIVDSFENPNIYKSFINDATIFNLQKYLDEIVSDATFQCRGHLDDMTIIGINLLKNEKK